MTRRLVARTGCLGRLCMLVDARLALGIAAILGVAFTTPVAAQPMIAPPPVRQTVDAYGIDLATGRPVINSETLSLGDDGRSLTFAFSFVSGGMRHTHMMWVKENSADAIVILNNSSRRFTKSGSNYVSAQGDGEKLVEDSTDYTYTSATGTVFKFSKALLSSSETYYGDASALISTVTSPDGIKNTYAYVQDHVLHGYMNPYWTHHIRLLSVQSSLGYQLRFEYQSDDPDASDPWEDEYDNWYDFASVKLYNLKDTYCDRLALTCDKESHAQFDVSEHDDGWDGEATSIISKLGVDRWYQNSAYFDDQIVRIIEPTLPSTTLRPVTEFVWSYSQPSRVTQVRLRSLDFGGGGSPTTTAYQRNYAWSAGGANLLASTDDSVGRSLETVANPALGVLLSATDGLNNETSYTYDASGRITQIERPEGDKTQVTYDSRGNVTQIKSIAKPGSGQSDIVVSATYASTCSNQVTCNRPLTITDARGKVTEIDYNATHGGVTAVREPADAGGTVPTTRYTYAQKNARFKTSDNALGNADPVYVLSKTSKCRTGSAPSCIDTSDEQVTEFTYSDGIAATNLQLLEETVRAGDSALTATTKHQYDAVGNRTAIDGPQTGTGDTEYRAYDVRGRMVARLSPDPDGSGPLPRPAQTFAYTETGQLTEAVSGFTYNPMYVPPLVQSGREVREYDRYGRLQATSIKAPGSATPASMTSYGYDAPGRVVCEVVRMNPPTSASGLPSTPCNAMTATAYGPDRVTAYAYDALDRVTAVTSADGTALEQITREQGYNANGTVAWVEDANGNRTAYEYDGFDRLAKTVFPSPTTPGTTNAADYESYTYDPAGNLLTRRSRAGETFGYSYDDLNRLLVKTVPERSGLATTHTRDVYYGYDLFGAQTFAKFDSASGEGVTFGYDVLGRPTSTVLNMDSVSRTLTRAFDAAGRLTSLTHPDSEAFTYEYDTLGRPKRILASGPTELAAFAYDLKARPSGQTRSAGTAPGLYAGYDPYSRLAQLGISNAGSNAVEWLFGYNAAGQTVRAERNNDAYAWDGHVNADRAYTPNGLNQYASVASTSFTYDANGNLTSDGSTTFTYDTENRLVGSTGGNGAALRYDPLGRLYEVVDATTSDTTRFLYDGDALVAEYNAAGTLLRRHIHGVAGGDDPLITYEGSTVSNSTLRHLYADRLGSIALSTDYDGSDAAINAYDEYGIPSGSNQGRFQYTGQAWLPELGMYHYKARMYSPTLGRFMQTDPIGYEDGMDWYAYVRNDPVNGVDPTGLCTGSRIENDDGTCASTGTHVAGPGGCIGACSSGPTATNSGRTHSEAGGGRGSTTHLGTIANGLNGIAGTPAPCTNCIVVSGSMPEGAASFFGLNDISNGIQKVRDAVGRVAKAVYEEVVEDSACCFTAGTLVATPAGPRAIETLKVGDLVMSRSDLTGGTVAKAITDIIPAHERVIWNVSIRYSGRDGQSYEESYETSEDHPWRTSTGDWVATRALNAGAQLELLSGTAVVMSVTNTKEAKLTYNIEVADFHTYFVGEAGVWVHNSCPPSNGPSQSPVWNMLVNWRGSTRTDVYRERYYQWDYTHQNIEVYNKRGRHIGVMDPQTGVMIGGAVRGRRINVR